jgi:hypothetical protein
MDLNNEIYKWRSSSKDITYFVVFVDAISTRIEHHFDETSLLKIEFYWNLSNVKTLWKDTTRKNAIHHKHTEITVPSFYPPDAAQEYARVTICAGPMGNLKKRQ